MIKLAEVEAHDDARCIITLLYDNIEHVYSYIVDAHPLGDTPIRLIRRPAGLGLERDIDRYLHQKGGSPEFGWTVLLALDDAVRRALHGLRLELPMPLYPPALEDAVVLALGGKVVHARGVCTMPMFLQPSVNTQNRPVVDT